MTNDNLEELFKARATTLDDVVTEAVGEDLARQGWNGYPGALALEDIAKVLKVGVAATDAALAQLECRYVGAAEDLIVCVHVAAHAVCSWVANLYMALCKPCCVSVYMALSLW